jgi:hypothetical protein
MKVRPRILALALLLLPRSAQTADRVGYLAEFQSVVECPKSNVLQLSDKPRDLHVGDTVVTRDAPAGQGTARAYLEDKMVVTIDRKSELTIGTLDPEVGSVATAIALRFGAVRVYARQGTTCRVSTSTAVATCHGTDFIVTFDPNSQETDVLVLSGVIEFHGVGAAATDTVTLRAGEMSRVLPGQSPSPPKAADGATVASRTSGMELIGHGTTERLTFGTDLLAGNTVLAEDQPPLRAFPDPWSGPSLDEAPGDQANPLFPVPGNLMISY